jgi:hypothetical protein
VEHLQKRWKGERRTFHAVPRERLAPGDWDDYVDRHPEGWWFHRSEWLAYCLEYSTEAADRSVALVDTGNGNVIGICPAIYEDGLISMGGEPCVGPLLNASVSYDSALNSFSEHGFFDGKVGWRWQHPAPNMNVTGDGFAHVLSMAPSWFIGRWSTVVVDLTKPQETLWHDLRKSYRSTIKAAHWTCEVVIGGIERWDEYETCHKAAAKRPRPQATYDHMREWVKSGHGRIAVALDQSQACVASILALTYKNRAYYASGPSVVRGMQHACQWGMIKDLQDHGVGWYEIGWTGQPGANTNIEFFKRGFGGERRGIIVAMFRPDLPVQGDHPSVMDS